MILQNGEEEEAKPFNLSRASAMGWVAPFLAPACVNITKISEKGEKDSVENVFNSEWVALAK